FKEVRKKITELENLNLKLAQRRNRLEAIFNSIGDGLTILDRNLNIVFANRIQRAMFPGVSLIGRKCFQAYYHKEDICKNCPSLKTMANDETLQGEVFIKDGKFAGHYFEWTTSPIMDQNGRVAEIILLMRDVTKRKDYEFKLMQADRMAAIGFLAAGIAHEINNPLTSISGFSEGLLKRLKKFEGEEDGKKLESFKEYLEIIHAETYRCKNIIQRLQEFSRISGDDFEPLQIDRIVKDTVAIFRQHAKDSKIIISFENRLTKGFGRIIGKESLLKHLFLNLFNHAFLCMEDGGALKLTSSNDDKNAEIQISHTGCVKPDRYHVNIFDPSCMTQATGDGNPIDLSICYHIVQHHKGDIQFSSNVDQGATFTLRFPLHSN
ncbi:MAG: histidine kinase dimerization/phospho-acceptor domain-containing protein, partial [Desulfobacterales bacterium]